MPETVTLEQYAKHLAWLASDQSKAYFRNVEALGIKTRMTEDGVFQVALALGYFLSQRIIFSRYSDSLTHNEHLIAWITRYLEATAGVNSIYSFHGTLDRFRQALIRTPEGNPHEIALNHCHAVLGDKTLGDSCPGMKLFAGVGAFVKVGASKNFRIS